MEAPSLIPSKLAAGTVCLRNLEHSLDPWAQTQQNGPQPLAFLGGDRGFQNGIGGLLRGLCVQGKDRAVTLLQAPRGRRGSKGLAAWCWDWASAHLSVCDFGRWGARAGPVHGGVAGVQGVCREKGCEQPTAAGL